MTHGPIHSISHHPTLNILVVGCGKGVLLTGYHIDGGKESEASWNDTRYLPDPPALPSVISSEEPMAQSIHFQRGQDSLIISYLHHGIVFVAARCLIE